jgi:hypothetical protein
MTFDMNLTSSYSSSYITDNGGISASALVATTCGQHGGFGETLLIKAKEGKIKCVVISQWLS